jgi:hypothetical protein
MIALKINKTHFVLKLRRHILHVLFTLFINGYFLFSDSHFAIHNGSSFPPVVCRRLLVLFTLFVFVCV